MSYIGNSPGVASQRVETAFTATSNQTAFTPSSGYTLGYCDVYQNGVKLVNGDDYTASDGATVTLATGAASGDSIVIVASFPRGLSDGYLKSEADAKYVALTGDQTVAGVKTLSSNPILSGGTANGVAYLNGSKVVTSGSALVFDGTSLGIGVSSPTKPLDVVISGTGDQSMISLRTTGASGQGLLLGVNTTNLVTTIKNNASSTYGMAFFAGSGSTEHMRLGSDGFLRLGPAGNPAINRLWGSSGNPLYGLVDNALTITSDVNTASHRVGVVFAPAGRTGGAIFSNNVSATGGNEDANLEFYVQAEGNVNATYAGQFDKDGVFLINTAARASAADHTSIKLAIAGEAHLQTQGCHLWFGDSTNSSPLGIGEGLVNTVGTDADFLTVYYRSSCRFLYNTTETVRITSNGNLLLGATSGSARLYVVGDNTNPNILTSGTGGGVGGITENFHGDIFFAYADLAGQNTANANIKVGRIGATGRSINAGGTINASGADYAEYMTKCSNEFVVAKGDVVGVNAVGKLTNVFADAVSFVVKSTDPSYVGGDSWGVKSDDKDGEQYTEEELEAQRQLVDRIAFAGQVPVNVTGATPGQYIVPVNDNGAIKGEAVSNPTFEQYQQAVGKVIAIEQDGRARIIVKVA